MFGVQVRTRTAPPAKGLAVDTGTLFLAGLASAGSLTKPIRLQSMADFEASVSARAGLSTAAYDYVEAFFREGGAVCYFQRYAEGSGAAETALTLFGPELGPGQLAVIGTAPGTELFAAMKTHCENNNRVALRDVNEADTVSEMEAVGKEAPANDDYGATFAPWIEIPGAPGVGGGPRKVPASAIVAAICNRVDKDGNPNRAAAGFDYVCQYATGMVTPIGETERAGLFTNGVNTFSEAFGFLQNYGFQTDIAESPNTPYWQFNCSRARMWIKARSQSRGQPYMFKTIDGKGKVLAAFQGDIEKELSDLYAVDGLYGDTPEDAYSVTTSVSVNTVEGIAKGEMKAVVEVRYSMHAKAVIIELVSVPITGSVS